MKQTIQTKLHQQLALTPQLQHAIKLLQLSTLELAQEVELAVEQNPLLEYTEDLQQVEPELVDSALADNEHAIDLDNTAITEDFATDTRWDDIYPPSPRANQQNREPQYEIQGVSTTNLTDHLLWQMRLSHFSELDTAIATAIIDSINNDGFLSCSLEDIRDSIGDNIEVELDEVNAVLHRIQNFDPTGVAACDLQECLLIQLQHYPANTPYLYEAQTIISNDLNLLGHRDYRQIMKKNKLKEEQLSAIVTLIQTLDPKPGAKISPLDTEYVSPDVFVSKRGNTWHIETNPNALPKIHINENYNYLMDKKKHEQEYEFLHQHLQEARWFLKSLESRNDTLLKVATAIVEHQTDFLEHGEEHMKPLILQTIADDLGMHESTISRITTHKYMFTPQGLFELKFFFSSHLTTDGAEDCSSTAIRAMIKRFINGENPIKPLSDNKITQMLAAQGIHVARRTVAKYREEMAIPPSNERKQLA